MSQGGVTSNVYDFCEIEDGGGSTQQRLLRGVPLEEATDARDAAAGALPPQGPLGSRQLWCGGADAYKIFAALPAMQRAWHVTPIDPAGKMAYTRAPAGDLRPLYAKLAAKYRLLIYSVLAVAPESATSGAHSAIGQCHI